MDEYFNNIRTNEQVIQVREDEIALMMENDIFFR